MRMAMLISSSAGNDVMFDEALCEQEAGKQMRFVLIGRTAHIPLHHDLDCREVLVGHKLSLIHI